MAEFVRENVYIPGRTVPVGQNEGQFVLGQTFAVAAAPFAFATHYVEAFAIYHGIEQFARFGGHFVVHFGSVGKNLFGSAVRFGLYFGEHGIIVIVLLFDAEIAADFIANFV